jgi:dTDP-4-amino-4,6-dideoxygalactose transaminase
MKKLNIPIFRLKFDFKSKFKFLKGSWDILSSDRPLGESKYVKEFEDKFAEMSDAKYALACSNGTTAIELALKALDVKGKKVLMPSNTFFATSVAITNAGGIIELLDMEPESFSISLKDLISKITPEVGAVVIVHIGGIISHDISKIVDVCKKNNVPLVEDAAHAHFSLKGTHRAGVIGDVGTFSFFPTKVMTTGEGGMITTNNKELYEKMKSLKNFGRHIYDSGIIVNSEGNNFKINEFTGLLGSIECDRVYSRIEKRTDLLERYRKNLSKTRYKVIKQKGNGTCAYYKAIVITPMDGLWLKKYCKEKGISLTGEVYRIPVHEQPLYKEQFSSVNLPNTDYYSKHHVCPPLYPELSIKEVDYICDVLKQALIDYEEQSSKTNSDKKD